MTSFQPNLFTSYATGQQTNYFGGSTLKTKSPPFKKTSSKLESSSLFSSALGQAPLSDMTNNQLLENRNTPGSSSRKFTNRTPKGTPSKSVSGSLFSSAGVKSLLSEMTSIQLLENTNSTPRTSSRKNTNRTPKKTSVKISKDPHDSTSSSSDSDSTKENFTKRVKKNYAIGNLSDGTSSDDEGFLINRSGIDNFDKENQFSYSLSSPSVNNSNLDSSSSLNSPFNPTRNSNFSTFDESPSFSKSRSISTFSSSPFTSSPLPPPAPAKPKISRYPNIYVINNMGFVHPYRGGNTQEGIKVDLTPHLKQEPHTITLEDRTIKLQSTPLGNGQFNKVYAFFNDEVISLNDSQQFLPLKNAICKMADTTENINDPVRAAQRNIQTAYLERLAYDRLASLNVPLPHRYVAPSPENGRLWGIYQKIQYTVPNHFILNWQRSETTIDSVSPIERNILKFGHNLLTEMAKRLAKAENEDLSSYVDPLIDDCEPKNVMFDLVDDGQFFLAETLGPDQIIETRIVDGNTILMRKKFVPYVSDFSDKRSSGNYALSPILSLKLYVWAWSGQQENGGPKSRHLYEWIIKDFPALIKNRMEFA